MKKVYSLILLIIFILSISTVSANVERNSINLMGKVIYLDAGHRR